jgi:hypothetical protein
MEEKANIKKRQNYRITIIMKDEVIVERFYRQGIALETVATMRKLFPDEYIGGVIEEKRKKWEVIWTLGQVVKK